MELAAPLASSSSPLARARLLRQLPLREAAAKAGLTEEQVTWLEEGRVYRFATPDDALLALLLYATALGIDHREARGLAGLPVPPKPLQMNPYTRLAVLGAVAAAVVALIAALTLPGRADERAHAAEAARLAADAKLPRAWQIHVDVRNGSGDINYTRRVASRIGALGYQVARVARADRFDYPESAVYYQRGGLKVAERLARQLQIVAKPLPGGKDARRLVVIVGPQRGPG
jgi:transcriptional regulator with XRE-family HTH domain